MEHAKQFGDTYNKFQLKIPKCELECTDEKIKHIIDRRLAEWNTYKVQ